MGLISLVQPRLTRGGIEISPSDLAKGDIIDIQFCEISDRAEVNINDRGVISLRGAGYIWILVIGEIFTIVPVAAIHKIEQETPTRYCPICAITHHV